MVEAERKQKVLDGIVDLWEQRRTTMATANAITALQLDRNEDSPVAHWAATVELDLVNVATETVASDLVDAREAKRSRATERTQSKARLREAEDAFRDAGGGTLEQLGVQIDQLGGELAEATLARSEFVKRTAGLETNVDSAKDLAELQATAIEFIDHGYRVAEQAISAEKNLVSEHQVWPNRSLQRELQAERESLEGRTGRVPRSWHEARVSAAEALGVGHTALPFVAELVDVAASESEWRVAAEVMLAPIAGVMLVDDRLLDKLTIAIDGLTWRTRLPYEGVELRSGGLRDLDPAMLSGKLMLKEESPFIWWVLKRVTGQRIDALCVESPHDLLGPDRRVTRSGQTRKGRSGAHGRSNAPAILGFDNTSRLAEIDQELSVAATALKLADNKLKALDAEGAALTSRRDAHIFVRDARWDAIDTASRGRRINELSEQRDRLRSDSIELAELEKRVELAAIADEAALTEEILAGQEVDALLEAEDLLDARREELTQQLVGLDERGRSHSPEQALMLGGILEEIADGTENYDPTTFLAQLGKVTNALRTRHRAAREAADAAETQLERTFRAYKAAWDDPNLGIGIESYEDYLEIYNSITASGLHEQREEWAHRVTSWTGEDLVPLHLAFDEAVEEIRARLAPVNAILETLPFGAHRDRLRIELRQRTPDTHARFRKQLKELSSGVLGHIQFDEVETRFKQLRGFIDLLRSGAGVGGHSRDFYLDVRLHIEVSAVSITSSGEVRSKYTSLGGKSGGETQELAAFIVGAALRYQLGDESRAAPRFAPVFLDEGFVKADSEFAGRSVRAWRGLGFQLVVATALGTVNALEPHMDQILAVTKNPDTGRARIDANARVTV